MLGLEVVPHGQPAREEHRRHLGRGFADLGVEGFRFLHDQDAEVRMLAAEQDGRRRATEAPPRMRTS
jgi:hypothetical protein